MAIQTIKRTRYAVRTHHMSGTKEYQAWRDAESRCNNPNHVHYKSYGAKGITMCAEWLNSFATFFKDMGRAGKGRSLDRLDGQKGYSPENCRWSTRQQQSENVARKAILLINFRVVGLEKGEKKPSAADVLREMNISFQQAQTGICGGDCKRLCFYDEKFCGSADCDNKKTKAKWKPFVPAEAPTPIDVWKP
jgi:hypothetical protein